MDEVWVSTEGGRYQVMDPVGQSIDTVDVATLAKWEVCLEHKSGVNWHTPSDPPEGKCDAHRLYSYPGHNVTVVPCQIVKAGIHE